MFEPDQSESLLRRVAVDATSQVVGGGVSVARDLVNAMAQERPDTHFALFCSSDSLAHAPYPANVDVEHDPALAGFRRRIFWQQRRLPSVLRKGGCDALLNLGGFAVFHCPIPQVSVWQNPNIFTRVRVPRPLAARAYIVLQRLVQGASMRLAEGNVFLTQESLREASTHWDMQRIPHEVIPNGLSGLPPAADDTELPGEPFILAVGYSYFHKNYEALIDAAVEYRRRFGEVPPVWIAGGKVDDAYHPALEARIRKHGLEERVRFLGPTAPEQIAALYAAARVYVMTSVLESFGLTPLEAMAHGTPVVAAGASCIPEVCGDGALYCDPHDPEDIAEKLHNVFEDERLRADLVARGADRVKDYSWAKSARRYVDVLDGCLENGPSRTTRESVGSVG